MPLIPLWHGVWIRNLNIRSNKAICYSTSIAKSESKKEALPLTNRCEIDGARSLRIA